MAISLTNVQSLVLASWLCATVCTTWAQPVTKPDTFQAPPIQQQDAGMPCRDVLIRLVAQAQANSPAVIAAQARLQAAAGTTLQASLLPNPQLGYIAQEIGNEDETGIFGMYVQQRKVRGNKIQLRHNVSYREYQVRSIAVQSELARVEIAVARTLYRTLVANQQMRTLRKLVTMTEQTTAAIARLVKAEEMAKSAELQAQVASMSLRTQLIAAEKNYESGWRALAALVNVPAETLPDINCNGFDELPDYQWDQLSQAVLTSLKTRRRELLVGKAVSQVELEQARKIVDLTWQLSVFYDDISNDVFTGVQLTHPLQLFDWNQGNIQRANADLAAAQNDVASSIQQTVVNLARAYRTYESQREQAELIATELLPASEKSLELTQMALRAGEIEYLEALVAQQAYAQAYQQYFTALHAAWQAAAQLALQFVE